MRGAQAQGRALLRPLRPRLRHPRDARPAAAHVPDPHLLGQQVRPPRSAWAGRACCSTSRSAPGPCVGEIDQRGLRPAGRRSCCDFLDGDTDAGRARGSRREMRPRPPTLEFERAARLRDRLASVRKAIENQQMVAERNEDLDVHRHRRGRARGRGPGVLRAPGPGGGPQGLHRSTRSRTSTPGELVGRRARGPLRRPAAARHAQDGAGARRARRRRPLRGVAERRCGAPRSRSGCPSGATSASCRRPSPATPREEFTRHRLRRAVRPQQPGQGPQRAAGARSACPRPRCASSATT